MDTNNIIIGVSSSVIAIIGSLVLVVLNSIKKTQEQTNIEIKEMNKDIRDALVKLGANDEKIFYLNKRLDDIYDSIKNILTRLMKVEEND